MLPCFFCSGGGTPIMLLSPHLWWALLPLMICLGFLLHYVGELKMDSVHSCVIILVAVLAQVLSASQVHSSSLQSSSWKMILSFLECFCGQCNNNLCFFCWLLGCFHDGCVWCCFRSIFICSLWVLTVAMGLVIYCQEGVFQFWLHFGSSISWFFCMPCTFLMMFCF